ncbi:MAG: tetratricopeptide repeat protein [Acidimicrobiia bacterium]|nr:tetratricopeptide repeat protein [Acidimicrobiia bacterium]
MRRGVAIAVFAAAVVGGLTLAWDTVRRDREFRRLIAAGDLALSRGETSAAIEAFSGAVALRPTSMVGHLKRGDTYRRRGQMNDALRDLQDAAALDPSATRPLELLGDVNLALEDYERALTHYQAYLGIDERAPRVLYKMALAHFRLNNIAGAVDRARDALALDAAMPEAHFLLGLSLKPSAPEDAMKALARAVELDPALRPAREELSALLQRAGRFREAQRQLDALADLEPDRPARLVDTAVRYSRAGRTDAALQVLTAATGAFPDDPVIHTALGGLWLELAETRHDPSLIPRATALLQTAAAGSRADGLALYGRALLRSGDAPGALRVLRQATGRLPVEPSAFLDLAEAADRLERPGEARDALASYVALAGDTTAWPGHALRIAELSLAINDAPTAAVWARRASATAPQGGRADAVLGEALIRLGRREDARQVIAEGLERDPQNQTLRRLRRQVNDE